MGKKYEIEKLGDIAVIVRDEKKEPFACGGIWIKTGEVCGVYIDPRHRGEGVDLLIMRALLDHAHLCHIPRLHFKVRKSYPPLAALFTRIGLRHFDWFEIDVPEALRILSRKEKIAADSDNR